MNTKVVNLDENWEEGLYWRRFDLISGLRDWLSQKVNPFGFEHVVLSVYTGEHLEKFSAAMIGSFSAAVAAYKAGERYVDASDTASIEGRVTTLLEWWDELEAAKPTNFQDGFGG